MSSSLMTNTSAMTALQTLQMTNQQLDQTQNEISTGYKVANASDNAAYWSIATTMRSDNNSLSTVNDSLGLGSATVNTAYTAMTSVKDTLDKIKSDLVTATQPGVDKSKIQADISQQLQQLKTYSDSASFSGNNWLSVNSSDTVGYNATQSVVSSFNRSANGGISLGTINVDITKVSLFDANTTTGAGLLQKGQALTAATAGNVANATNSSTTAAATVNLGTFAAFTLDGDNTMQFQLAVNGGSAQTVTINKATVDAALNSTDGKVATDADMEKVVVAALKNAGIDAVDHTGTPTASQVKVDGSGANLSITTGLVGATGAPASLTISGATTSNNGNFYNVMDIDITNATATDLNNYLGAVDAMFQKVTSAASDLGSVQSRISSQQTFVKALMNSIDSGVGSLVDADMNEASTRLKALQTQQQLGIQALSIANSNSQSILSLFR